MFSVSYISLYWFLWFKRLIKVHKRTIFPLLNTFECLHTFHNKSDLLICSIPIYLSVSDCKTTWINFKYNLFANLHCKIGISLIFIFSQSIPNEILWNQAFYFLKHRLLINYSFFLNSSLSSFVSQYKNQVVLSPFCSIQAYYINPSSLFRNI